MNVRRVGLTLSGWMAGVSMRRRGLALSGWVAAAFTALPPAMFPRVVVVTVFLVACPGLAALRWVRPPGAVRDPDRVAVLESCVLTLVLSLTLAVLVTEVLFLAGAFTFVGAVLILAAATSVLALAPRPDGERPNAGRQPQGPADTAGSPR
ncbi:hypothetical protein ABZT03_29730 [Streptomyces sp. NPDC005574]|uniref:hypothetical protein n=1 Tax=Streptomyces sp. NPDC005574 TaxID=3156891 RepID=UPI0033B850C0